MSTIFAAIKGLGGSLISGVAPYLILIMLAAGGAFYAFHATEVANLKSELKELNAEVGTMQQANAQLLESRKNLTDALGKQNTAVSNLLNAANTQTDKTNAAVSKAVADAAQWKVRFTTLISRPATENDCADTSKLLGDYYDMRSQELQGAPK